MQNFLELLYSKYLLSNGVSIDTRSLKEGDLFFALSGPNFNGNDFAEDALRRGALCAVVDDEKYAKNDNYLLTEDSLQALQQLSVFHRKRFKKPVLAITGSNGKTTTKELVAKVLSQHFDILATKGNLNNHIGVPLTLLQLHPQIEIAVIEMGASRVGDIAELCSYALPTHGLITNIGHAHTETFGGIEGVLRGKTELFDFLSKTGGKVFINRLDERLKHLHKRFADASAYPDADLQLEDDGMYLSFQLGETSYPTHLTGAYNFANVAAAVSIGRHFEIQDAAIGSAISAYQPDNWRSQIVDRENVRIIVDAYNANPDSMTAALINFSKMEGAKAVILGDMLELQDPELEHRKLGKFVGSLNIDKVYLVGELMQSMAEEIPGSYHFGSREELIEAIDGESFSNYQVLLKASRKMRLEELVDRIN